MWTKDLGLSIFVLHCFSINSAVHCLVPKLPDQIRIFTLVDFPTEVQAFFRPSKCKILHESTNVHNIYDQDCLRKQFFGDFRESGGSIENIFLNFLTIFDLSTILEVNNKFSLEIFEKIGFPTF